MLPAIQAPRTLDDAGQPLAASPAPSSQSWACRQVPRRLRCLENSSHWLLSRSHVAAAPLSGPAPQHLKQKRGVCDNPWISSRPGLQCVQVRCVCKYYNRERGSSHFPFLFFIPDVSCQSWLAACIDQRFPPRPSLTRLDHLRNFAHADIAARGSDVRAWYNCCKSARR